MLLIGVLIAITVVIVILIFASPQLSPIPYFPSNPKDMQMILDFLPLKNDKVIIDLGAGDGIVVFQTAHKTKKLNLNTEFIAVETNPILVAILYFKRQFHPNKKRIHIVMKDMFKINYKSLLSDRIDPTMQSVFYLYISPWLIKQAIDQVQKSIKQFEVVSYFYPLTFLKEQKKKRGKNSLYFYTIKK